MGRKALLLLLAAIIIYQDSYSQGCVAIRGGGHSCAMTTPGMQTKWTVGVNQRYFRSYRHFVGKEEQHEREDSATNVINYTWSADMFLARTLTPRWSLAAGIPFTSNVRSSLYEHYGNSSKSPNARNYTRSIGIGDARVIAYRWMFDPAKNTKRNLQLGLGMKLPTGDYRYSDFFHRNDSTYVLGPVDQSIQLGDGGTGIIFEAKGYWHLSSAVTFYTDFYYLANPREQNGVSTARGGTPSATAVKYFTSVMSVPDQFMVRGGAAYNAKKFTGSLGMRVEAVPSSDLIGGDRGFRRPGYVVSVEPSALVRVKKAELFASVPFAIERNRTQSHADKAITKATGAKAHGDAAFANYSANAGIIFRF